MIKDPKKVAKYIEHTLLSMDATTRDIEKLCEEAVNEGFHGVCVNPVHVRYAVKKLSNTNVKVISVIGFPLGQTFTEVKVREAVMCVKDGANELDVVSNISLIKEGKYDKFREEIEEIIREVKRENKNVIVKVIIELGCLSKKEGEKASLLAVKAGANFIKTSTGKGPRGVKLEDVLFLKRILPNEIGIKAAGGIRSLKFTLDLIKAGANRIGTSSAMKIMSEARSGK